MNARRYTALTICTAALTLTAACGSDHRGTKDAPHGPGDNSPAQIYNMPDDYPNIASKCVGNGYRAWVTTHDSTDSPPVLRPDKTCPGYDGSQAGVPQGDEVPAPKQSPAS